MKYVLGIDFGAEISLALYDETGREVASRKNTYDTERAEQGRNTAFAENWTEVCFNGIRRMLEESNVNGGDVAGVGTCGHPSRLVMLGDDGKPLGSCLSWNSRVPIQNELNELKEKAGSDILIRTAGKLKVKEGLGPMLLWYRTNEPELWSGCTKVLYAKDYITYALTGKTVMDVSDASGTMLFDVKNRSWSKEIIDAVGLKIDMLPEVHECAEIVGYVTEEAAKKAGLSVNTKVIAGLTNKASIAITSFGLRDGDTVPTVGPVGNLIAVSPEYVYDPEGHANIYCSAVPGEYFLMCDTKTCATSAAWFGENLLNGEFEMPKRKGGKPFEPIERHCAMSPAGSNGVWFLPYLAGEDTPHFDKDAKGVFFGITTQTTKEDMCRAVLEGVCYSMLDCFEYLRKLGVRCENHHYHMMGEAPYWQQMLADVTGQPAKIMVPRDPVMGAAMLASVSVGICPDIYDAAARFTQEGAVMEPCEQNHNIYSKGYEIYKALYSVLNPIYKSLY